MKQSEFNKKFVECISHSQNERELLRLIKDSPRLSAARALEVYREDYQIRMTEALKNTFRATHSILGDEDFFKAAQDYLNAHSSSFSDLDEYGNQFAEFLQTHHSKNDYPFLSQLAHFEWAFREVFHVSETAGLNPDELQQYFADQNAKLVLVPSAKILHYDFAIEKLYSLNDEDNNFDYSSEQFILLFKKNSLVKLHLLSKNQWELVKNFHTPSSLLNCIQKAPATMTPEEMSRLSQILAVERILLKSL